MGDAAGMASHPDDTTDPRRDQLAEVIPFPTRHVPDDETPPSCCRDPREFPYGMLIVERRMFGGANGFHWFSSEAEAAHFLRCGLWHLIGDDQTTEQVRCLYVEALSSTSRIKDDWLRDVSEQQDDVLVVWHGLFNTLITGGDTFAAGKLAGFQGKADAVPLTSNADINDFIQHLASYRG